MIAAAGPAPRLEVDLAAVEHNARTLVDRLAGKGIRVTGVAKTTLGSPGVAAAMVRGGAAGIGDSRVANLVRLRAVDAATPLTLIRSPMLSQVDDVVRAAGTSLNTEAVVLDALSAASARRHVDHDVVLMVELGDLREGVAASEVVALARSVAARPGLHLAGIGTNLACQSGVVPDQDKMDELSRLVACVEVATGEALRIVSGGNSANLDWALTTADVGRVDELRLGEAILLGTEPLHRRVVAGLRTDAFTLIAEVIESRVKPVQPWGRIAQTAFGDATPRHGTGTIHQVILALGRQDTDPDGLTPPPGTRVLGMSSDHLVVDVGEREVAVGDELAFQLDFSALLRATTSPYVTGVERRGPVTAVPGGGRADPAPTGWTPRGLSG